MKSIINKLINTGVRKEYQSWECHITRKLNSVALITFLNLVLGISFFLACGYYEFIFDCAMGLIAAPLVIVLNRIKNYLWAAYWFFCYGFWFFIPINLKMGSQSFIILFYFPVIISMVQILGRKELLKHLFVLSVLCLASIIIIAFGFKYKLWHLELNEDTVSNLAVFHIILCFITTMAFIIVMVSESVSQENLIRKTLAEKEILLAEVFHRVKNNMNIVTSLLNLRKNMSESQEVKEALEECRGRVFAMALVHDNIFNKNNITALNFKDYIQVLVTEIANSFGEHEKAEITLATEDVHLDLSYAIPCGLILNELITNSFKHACPESEKLIIHVKLRKQKNTVELEVKDNGSGLPEDGIKNSDSLGMELIKSLSEQVGGTYGFCSKDGLTFNLKFKITS
jgi:two-component sensor histidine kinase